MRIIIEPNDVLLFRELKHFAAGRDHVARSMLPLPQTVAGAIRSKILAEQNFSQQAKDYVGYGEDEPEKDDCLTIDGVFLWDEQELFVTPMDIVESDYGRGYIKPRKIDEFGVEFFHPPAEPCRGFVKAKDLAEYLKGELDPENLEIKNVVREKRIGVGLRDSKTSEEHMLYTVEFLRIPAISVWTSNLKFLPKEGLLKLGGEGRFVKYRIEENKPFSVFEKSWEKVRDEISNRFKLYVATHMLIESSRKFTWNVESELKSAGIKVRNIVPLIGKPLKVSGWNYAKNEPKSVKYAVPAGSVYFVEFKGELNLDRPYVKLGRLTKLGYGLCFLGVWK